MTQQTDALQAEVTATELTAEELVEADRREPDVAQFGGGVSSDEQHACCGRRCASSGSCWARR